MCQVHTDEKKTFGMVGGVAGAVFTATKEDRKLEMKTTADDAVDDVQLQLLYEALALESKTFLTDYTGDALFHIVPEPGEGYEDYYTMAILPASTRVIWLYKHFFERKHANLKIFWGVFCGPKAWQDAWGRCCWASF